MNKENTPKCGLANITLTILVFTFVVVFSSCDREPAPGQAQRRESLQPLAVEQIVVPEYRAIPGRGVTPRVLSPILQEFGNEITLAIMSPEWISRYGEQVVVRGRAYARKTDGSAEIAFLGWEILDSDHREEINYDPDGYFEFAIPTLGLPTVFYLRIVAVDNSGHSAERLFWLIAERSPPAAAVPPPPEATAAAAGTSGTTDAEEETQVRVPVLTLTRPGNNEYFSSALPISGELLDSAGRAFLPEEIESFTWEVVGSELRGELEVDEQGGISAIVDAAALRQDALLILRAVLANGQVAEGSVHLRADISAPLLEIQSPRGGEVYDRVVVVRGSVVDRVPVSLHWKIIGVSGLSGQLSLPAEGSFKFDIPTRGLEGIQIVELRAEDQLGNASVSTVTLRGREPVAEIAEPVVPAIREAEPPPRLIVASPADPSYYRSLVAVEGLVVEGKTLSWEIPGTGLEGDGIIGRDGRFALQIPTSDLRGTQMLRLIATGRGGEQAEKVIVLLDEEIGPEIALTAPENRSYYRQEIRLEGCVGNPEDDWNSVGEVARLSLQLRGTEEAAMEIPFDGDGRFHFVLPATGLTGKQTMILTAEDRNGDLSQLFLTLLDGNLNPSVLITSPRVEQLYGSRVRVSGMIIDPYADSAAMGGIESVAYDVTSPEVFSLVRSVPQGRVELQKDNTFDFVITTGELSGPQDVNILVRARSGNQTKASVRILEGEADIPVFSVEPVDGRALLRWDPLPSATRYSLSYRTVNPGRSQGRETRIDGVSSPYLLTGLVNGNRYVFQLSAALPGEPDSESAEKWAIPLSPDTLRPATAGEFEQIQISWPSIPGSEQYELWRSTRRDGEYTKIAGPFSDTRYLDKDVLYGRSYFYKVAPSSAPELPSNPVPGESTAFPVEKLESAGVCRLNQARGLTLHGGYAFVADGSEGIKIVDISAPDTPTLIGGFHTAAARDIAVRGGYAFVADGERGLKVLDVSDPRYPAEIGMRKTMDARAIALEGDIAFVADGSSGVKIIDVSSPVQPTRIGSQATEYACDLAVRDGRLYLADGTGGLKIYQISAPAELQEVGHLSGVDARSLAVEGSFLYLAAGAEGLIIMDISVPGDPIELGRFAVTETLDVGVSGAFVYLVDSSEGMIVVDVADPARPRRFAGFPAEGTSSVSVRGHYAYLATALGLQVVHILIQGRSVPIAAAAVGGKAYGLSVSGPRAYLACHDLGVRVVDISDPAGLSDDSVVGAWSGDYSVDVEVADSVAFVANGRRGVSILDLAPLWDDDPLSQPQQTGSYYTGGTAHRTVFRSDFLFVADGQEGLKILDVTVANNPTEIGSVPSADARDVAVLPGYALVADGHSGLIVCDISDPSDPIAISTLEGRGVHRIVVRDTLAATAGRTGVQLYDFSDPRNPKTRGRFESGYVEGIFLDGGYLYIAEGYRGLTILDIQSFDRPVTVSACSGIYAVDVAVHNGYALVADSRRIQVVEVLIPQWLRRSPSRR